MEGKNKSKIVFILGLLIFAILLWRDPIKNTHNENSSASLDQLNNKNISPIDKAPLAHLANQAAQADQSDSRKLRNPASIAQNLQDLNDQDVAIPDLPQKNDPVMKVLQQYYISSEDSFGYNYDRWFVSQKYSAVSAHDYRPEMGAIIEKRDNTFYIEAQGAAKDDLPPLVVSLATNREIPLTGHALVKFNDLSDVPALKDFILSSTKENIHIVEDPSLLSVKRLLIVPEKKSKIISIYQNLKKEGGSNIQSVEVETRPYFKVN